MKKVKIVVYFSTARTRVSIAITVLLFTLCNVALAQGIINARPLKIFSSGTPITSITLQGAPTFGSAYTLTMPGTAPAANQLLISDASGTFLWGQISNAQISSSAAISYSKLNLSNSIVAGDITSNAITTAKIADNSVTGAKIALGADAVGDIMYFNGSDYVRLPKGTAGQVLSMNAGATAPEWATPNSGGGTAAGFGITAADQTFNTTSFTDVNDLAVQLEAGKTYKIFVVVNHTRQNSGTSDGYQLRLAYTGSLSVASFLYPSSSISGTDVTLANPPLTATLAGSFGSVVSVECTAMVTASTSGTLKVQFCKNQTTNNNPTVAKVGSHITAIPLN